MKTKLIIKYCDPSHGWIKVSKLDPKLNLIRNKITSCSYESKHYLYLEEDYDAPLYTNLFENIEIKHRYTNNRSKIRQLNTYKGN